VRICALAGGVGSGRFLSGLIRVVDPQDLTLIGNTGDDERIRGLHICPDIDTVLYHLAGTNDWQRGWGVVGETFVANERYAQLTERAGDLGLDMQEWFGLGDRDLATHMFRTQLLDAGRTLSEATDALRRALGIGCRMIPMSDDPIRTKLVCASGERLDFQTYFVQRHHAEPVAEVEFEGADSAQPAPGVLDTIADAHLVLIPPGNPLVTIAPILAVPGVRDAVASTRCIAVSPIVGGKAIKGPADALLASLGHDISATGVARIYRGLIEAFVIDETDSTQADTIEDLGMSVLVCDTIMSGVDGAARLAKMVLDHAG
jgi:LPPG:FO 2-phospho-L-lactate transferase